MSRLTRIADRVDMDRLKKAIRDGATAEQISERFGMAIGTAHNWLYRIRKEIRAGV